MKLTLLVLSLFWFSTCKMANKDLTSSANFTNLNPFDSNKDSDSDGLSDFEEIHKYFTDPNSADSDADGQPDGDWNERREYAYTVELLVEIVDPIDITAMNNFEQDARLETDNGLSNVIRVVVYPYTTIYEQMQSSSSWQSPSEAMQTYLKPGLTTNWDEQLQQAVLKWLAADGIDPKQLTDVELVKAVSDKVLSEFASDAPYTAYHVEFTEKDYRIIEALRSQVFTEEINAPYIGQPLESFASLGFMGKELFSARKYGSCTPSAILLTTILRALGIPTRIVLAIPPIDSYSDQQMDLLRSGIQDNKTRMTITAGVGKSRSSWSSHTFNEVFVGGRWVKLNYNHLGQKILDKNYFGLLIHVNTFTDWSQGNIGMTWGMRQSQETDPSQLTPLLSSRNAYTALSIRDQFPVHRPWENPPLILTPNEFHWISDSGLEEEVRRVLLSPNYDVIVFSAKEIDKPDAYYAAFRDNADPNIEIVSAAGQSHTVQWTGTFYTGLNGDNKPYFVVRVDRSLDLDPSDGYKVRFANQHDLQWNVTGLMPVQGKPSSVAAKNSVSGLQASGSGQFHLVSANWHIEFSCGFESNLASEWIPQFTIGARLENLTSGGSMFADIESLEMIIDDETRLTAYAFMSGVDPVTGLECVSFHIKSGGIGMMNKGVDYPVQLNVKTPSQWSGINNIKVKRPVFSWE